MMAVVLVAVAGATSVRNEAGRSLVRGSLSKDIIRANDKGNRIYGFKGNDQLYGNGGSDIIVGGPGRDLIVGGAGNDLIDARDGQRDVVFCGPGQDNVARDKVDLVKKDCERSSLKPSALPKAPTPVKSPVRMSPPKANPFKLTVNLRGAGTVSSKPSGILCPGLCRATFPLGTRVVLIATPSSGETFDAWGATCKGKRVSCAVRINTNVWVRAMFSGASTSPPPPTTTTPVPSPTTPPASHPNGEQVVLNGSSWKCSHHVDLDLVKVTDPPDDAVQLGAGCSGTIRRLEVDTSTEDGVKIRNVPNAAHDLTILGGYVHCHDLTPGVHQDAVQAMGGHDITFWGLEFNCLLNSNFFVNRAGAGAGVPTSIVCEGCKFGPHASTTVRVDVSVSSGARNSQACVGRNTRDAFYFSNAARDPVDQGNITLPRSDPYCQR